MLSDGGEGKVREIVENHKSSLHVFLDTAGEEIFHQVGGIHREEPEELVEVVEIAYNGRYSQSLTILAIKASIILRGTVSSKMSRLWAETMAAATSEGFRSFRNSSKRILTFLHKPVSTM